MKKTVDVILPEELKLTDEELDEINAETGVRLRQLSQGELERLRGGAGCSGPCKNQWGGQKTCANTIDHC